MRTGDPGDRRGRPRRRWAPAAVAAIVVGAIVVGAVVATSVVPRGSAGRESQVQARAAGPYVAVLAPRVKLGADDPTPSSIPSASVAESVADSPIVLDSAVNGPVDSAVDGTVDSTVDGTVVAVVNGPQDYLDPARYPPGDGTSGLPGGGAEFQWDGTSVGVYWHKDVDQLVLISEGSSTCPLQMSATFTAEASRPDDQRVHVTFVSYTMSGIGPATDAGCADDQALTASIVRPPTGITSSAPLSIEFDDEVFLPPRGDR